MCSLVERVLGVKVSQPDQPHLLPIDIRYTRASCSYTNTVVTLIHTRSVIVKPEYRVHHISSPSISQSQCCATTLSPSTTASLPGFHLWRPINDLQPRYTGPIRSHPETLGHGIFH